MELYLQTWMENLGNVVLYSDNCNSSLSGPISCFQYTKNDAWLTIIIEVDNFEVIVTFPSV